MKRGIDISSHNEEVDMLKVKNYGIDFIILRLGYGKNQIDTKFYENYRNATNLNIPIGVYLYSYATNITDAMKEAELVLNTIKNLRIEYPVFIDMEDADNYKLKNNVSYSKCIDICEAFCNVIENSGYYVGIYANLDWLNNKIYSNRLKKFDKWVAQWGKECTYKEEYGIWQYSNNGVIPGIKGYIDLNYSLKDYLTIIKKSKLYNLEMKKTIYVVQAGDNLSKIAEKYNVNWKEIYNLNKNIIGSNPNLIISGQKLIIKGDKNE